MFYVIGVSLAFFLAVMLITKSNKTTADVILSVWLLWIGLHLALFYIAITYNYTEFPYLLGIGVPFPLLHGPLLYFYTAALTNQHRFLKKYWILHFAPLVIGYLLLSPFYLLSIKEKFQVLEANVINFQIETRIIGTLVNISGILYVIVSLWLLRQHGRLIKERFSYSEKINLVWLRYLVYGTGLVWIAVLFRNNHVIFSSATVFVIFLGYFGINQVGIFNQLPPSTSSIKHSDEGTTTRRYDNPIESSGAINSSPIADKPKYEKSGLNESIAREIHKNLILVMEKDKPYLNPELTLDELAEKVNVNPHILSQVINTIESKSFYDYINLNRVEHFKELVLKPENIRYTLLALALECGFNSKTAFNRNFKSITGTSPSQYIKQLQIQLQR
jgi:AraC-like DNA-binding protein